MTALFEEIAQELKRTRNEGTPIPQSRVRDWMEREDADADAFGATYVFLSKAEHTGRVAPPLEFDPVFHFMLRYYEFCLKTNPESKWANSSYSAGLDLVGWFVWMWDEKREEKYFESIKAMLEKVYVAGGPEIKKCIEKAVVEHLFERKDIRAFFSDWRDNPQLRPAYEEGKVWVEGGGTSPLTERRQR
jgi:hypothetical protein